MNRQRLAEAFGALLRELPGIAPPADQLEAWVERLVSAWADELLGGESEDPATSLGTPLAVSTKRQEVGLNDIAFALVCPHHLTLAVGQASIRYWPRHTVAGPSGLVRLIDTASRRRILQEEAAELIADTLDEVLQPRGLEVILETEQTCVSCRGVRRQGTRFVTRVRRGVLAE
jgi:GTP cyclohydrolase I